MIYSLLVAEALEAPIIRLKLLSSCQFIDVKK